MPLEFVGSNTWIVNAHAISTRPPKQFKQIVVWHRIRNHIDDEILTLTRRTCDIEEHSGERQEKAFPLKPDAQAKDAR